MDIPFKTEGYDARLDAGAPYAVHVGITTAEIAQIPRFLAFCVDGDGWNAWGESPGTDRNDQDTLHVVFLTHSLPELIVALADHAEITLVEIDDGTSEQNTVLAVTDPEDWSEGPEGVTGGAINFTFDQIETIVA